MQQTAFLASRQNVRNVSKCIKSKACQIKCLLIRIGRINSSCTCFVEEVCLPWGWIVCKQKRPWQSAKSRPPGAARPPPAIGWRWAAWPSFRLFCCSFWQPERSKNYRGPIWQLQGHCTTILPSWFWLYSLAEYPHCRVRPRGRRKFLHQIMCPDRPMKKVTT